MFSIFKNRKDAPQKNGAVPVEEVLKKAAHDLGSPISVIRGFVDFKNTQGVTDPDEAAYLEAVKKSLDKMEGITASLQGRPWSPPKSPAASHAMVAAQTKSGQKTVLVVDDDEGIRFQWKALLKSRGYSAIEVSSGEELLAMPIDFNALHAAIVDYQYEHSNLNGLDVVEYLKRKNLERIFMCTANYQDEDLCRQAKNLGVRFVTGKPIRPERILGEL